MMLRHTVGSKVPMNTAAESIEDLALIEKQKKYCGSKRRSGGGL